MDFTQPVFLSFRTLERQLEQLAKDTLERDAHIKGGESVEVGDAAGVHAFNGTAVGGKPIDPKVVSLH